MKTYTGSIVRRSGKATELGFPTINIPFTDPDVSGIFAATVRIEGTEYMGAAYANPERKTLEAYLFDFTEMLEDGPVSITLVEKIREDAQFESDPELKAAIENDVARIRYYFINTPG